MAFPPLMPRTPRASMGAASRRRGAAIRRRYAMKLSRKMLAVAAVAAAAGVGTATPALAGGGDDDHGNYHSHHTRAEVLRVYATSDTTAKVVASYRCFSDTPGDVALWVSVKQAESRRAEQFLTTEGSSQKAAAWVQTHAQLPNCDGRRHVDAFAVDQAEQGFGTLKRGIVYVQFCLFDANYPLAGMEPLSDMHFRYLHHAHWD